MDTNRSFFLYDATFELTDVFTFIDLHVHCNFIGHFRKKGRNTRCRVLYNAELADYALIKQFYVPRFYTKPALLLLNFTLLYSSLLRHGRRPI